MLKQQSIWVRWKRGPDFKKEADLKPHRMRYWMNNERDKEPEVFEAELKRVCEHYADALRCMRREHICSQPTRRRVGYRHWSEFTLRFLCLPG